jgi:hypothetical protein
MSGDDQGVPEDTTRGVPDIAPEAPEAPKEAGQGEAKEGTR